MSNHSESHGGPGDEDTGLSAFDDIAAHSKILKETMARAKQIITYSKRGFSKEERKHMRAEIPKLVLELRQLLVAQLQKEGAIHQLDRSDDSYDNVYIDNELRKQLAALRNIHTNLNTMIGTRTVRKLTAFIVEDIPNWFTVKWRQLKDNVYQLSKTTALATGAIGATAVAGYSIANGGIGPGLTFLGQDLRIAGSFISDAVKMASPHVVGVAKNVGANISWVLGKLSALFHPGAATAVTPVVL